MICALLMAFAAKPAIRACFSLLDVEYEYTEILGEEEDTEEKEIDDLEDTDKLIESSSQDLSDIRNLSESNHQNSNFKFSDFYPGVQLPPPELPFV